MNISPDNSAQDIIDAVEAAARQRAANPQPASNAEARRRAAWQASQASPGPQPARTLDKWTAWVVTHPQEAGWILRHESSFPFAAAMHDAVRRWGALTEKQAAAVAKCMQREAAQAARPAASDLDQGSVAALRTCFDRAAGNRILDAVLRIALTEPDPTRPGKTICRDAFMVSAAKPESRNPGSLYVKQRGPDGSVYIGKVTGAQFMPGRDCTDEAKGNFIALCADPATAAVAFGRHFGKCGICGRTLSHPESLARGIGPDCAERFGW